MIYSRHSTAARRSACTSTLSAPCTSQPKEYRQIKSRQQDEVKVFKIMPPSVSSSLQKAFIFGLLAFISQVNCVSLREDSGYHDWNLKMPGKNFIYSSENNLLPSFSKKRVKISRELTVDKFSNEMFLKVYISLILKKQLGIKNVLTNVLDIYIAKINRIVVTECMIDY